jgi:hypothetical protein
MKHRGGFAMTLVLVLIAALAPWLTLLLMRAVVHERLSLAAERSAVAAAAATALLDAWEGGEAIPERFGSACTVVRAERVEGAAATTLALTVAFEGVSARRYRALAPP